MSLRTLRLSAIPIAEMKVGESTHRRCESLEPVFQLDPECPAVLVDDIHHVFSRAGIPVFLIHEVVDVPGQFPSFDDPLTEEGEVQGYKTGWRYFRRE